ncbi:MAG TPA: hypothetical protein VK973_09100 [Arenicellales bacterium]|nr:hypothetical protein [Arenicellales bacterium]
MKSSSRLLLYQLLLIFGLKAVPAGAAAEEFKYYVWIDQRGIVHAEEEPPKGVDYQVRIIEDINANVVPAKDFRVYGDLPPGYGEDGDGGTPPADAGAGDD